MQDFSELVPPGVGILLFTYPAIILTVLETFPMEVNTPDSRILRCPQPEGRRYENSAVRVDGILHTA